MVIRYDTFLQMMAKRHGELTKERLIKCKITEREMKVLELRYSNSCRIIRSYAEIGKMFKVTAERIRQIDMKAKRKISQYLV